VDLVPISNHRFYRSLELPPNAVRLNAAMLTNQVQLLIQSPPGCRLDIQRSTDLKSWTRTTTITNVLGVYDYRESPGNASQFFYRAVVVPWRKGGPAPRPQPGNRLVGQSPSAVL